MDICFDTEKGRLNYRVAAIIKKDNKYLVTENPKGNYLSLIGGRLKSVSHQLKPLHVK